MMMTLIINQREKDKNSQDIKPARGIFYMILSVAGLTLYHLLAKIAYDRNDKLTNIDCLAFVGLANFTIYLANTMINGVSLSIWNFHTKSFDVLFA